MWDYAANTDDQRSISGGKVRLRGCPVTFRSQTQKFVNLSSNRDRRSGMSNDYSGHVICLPVVVIARATGRITYVARDGQ